jgi:hypothetical protein
MLERLCYGRSMTTPKKKRPRDISQLAASIVNDAGGEEKPAPKATSGKNPAAVALGRLGGLKGGKARAAKLSAKKRKEIAKKAAEARWGKSKKLGA